jgi:acetyl esterase/lipase
LWEVERSAKKSEQPEKTRQIMKKALLTAALAAATGIASAQTIEIPLWPDGPAESNGITEPELRRDDWTVTNVSEAAVYVRPAEGANTGRAILICPGGGYSNEAANHEGRMFAEWFASRGITAVVLKYRLPNGHSEIPLADARQAMRVIRRRAEEWGVDTSKVGVIGFSAGGHLASTLLTHFDEGSRPDFGILFYPVVTMTEATHGGSRGNLLGKEPSPQLVERFSNERQVTADTPPTMIFFSDDDKVVPPVNGTMFYDALKAAGVPSAMYVFPTGGHGWGFNGNFKYHEAMKAATMDWIARF